MSPQSSTSRLRPLAYVNAERTPLYRAVMGLFMAAKERFLLHLRPSEVRAGLAERGFPLDEDPQLLDAVLDQLCDWGNLEPIPTPAT